LATAIGRPVSHQAHRVHARATAASLRNFHDHGEALAHQIATREGVDPDTAPRPHIVVTLFAGLVSLASRQWKAAGADDTETMLALLSIPLTAYRGRGWARGP
jgi:hypothetical protein